MDSAYSAITGRSLVQSVALRIMGKGVCKALPNSQNKISGYIRVFVSSDEKVSVIDELHPIRVVCLERVVRRLVRCSKPVPVEVCIAVVNNLGVSVHHLVNQECLHGIRGSPFFHH